MVAFVAFVLFLSSQPFQSKIVSVVFFPTKIIISVHCCVIWLGCFAVSLGCVVLLFHLAVLLAVSGAVDLRFLLPTGLPDGDAAELRP